MMRRKHRHPTVAPDCDRLEAVAVRHGVNRGEIQIAVRQPRDGLFRGGCRHDDADLGVRLPEGAHQREQQGHERFVSGHAHVAAA